MKKNFWQELNKPILALAPMAGITDSAFRQICRSQGADLVYSEMASASALFFKPQKTLHLLKFSLSEKPYVVQLFGKNPEHFARAAKIITKEIKPSGIDLNFGCPAKKVYGHGAGCALMLDIPLAKKIILAVSVNTALPVSLKIRAGVKKVTALKFIGELHDAPFAALMLHGRTYENGFDGPADFALAEKIKKLIPEKIVLANGGIVSPWPARECLKKYPSLDGLGIGRGALGQPWIFKEIKEALKTPSLENFKPLAILSEPEKVKELIIEHSRLIHKIKKKSGFFEIRKHLAWYVRGFPGAPELRRALVQAENLKEIKKILDKI
jgi:tRNA-dihydrouridine synthase B